jgi:hypothetical protein
MATSPTSLFPLPFAKLTERIQVKLDSGELVTRDRSDLVELPPHLAVPLEEIEPPVGLPQP